MSKIKAEYIWIDGYSPTANVRSKTKIVYNKIESKILEYQREMY